MVHTSTHHDRAIEDASAWFARLNTNSVTTAELIEFQAWRRIPENDAAYDSIDRLWRRSADLKVDPDIGNALNKAMKGPSRRPIFNWLFGVAPRPSMVLGAVGALALLALAISQIQTSQIYSSAVGDQRLIALPDGSHIRLDTDTRIAVRFKPQERRVTLFKGQAFFQVAHDAARPFLVDAGGTETRALGTEFDVRREIHDTSVTLIEGAILVRAQDAPGRQTIWSLTPGEAVTTGLHPKAPRPIDLQTVTSWTSGRLIFHDLPLSEAAAEVSRYSAYRVAVAPTIGDIRVNGTFNSGDTTAFVSAVSRLYGLAAQKRADGTIALEPSEHSNPA